MQALLLLVAVSVVIATWTGVVKFDRYVKCRFGCHFFTDRTFIMSCAIITAILVGRWWWLDALRLDALHHHGDPLNGQVFVVVGVGGAVALFIRNFRRTNVLVGLCGSLLQAAFFCVAVLGGFKVLMIYVIRWVLARGRRPLWPTLQSHHIAQPQ